MVRFAAIIEIRGVNPFVLVDKKLAEQVKAGWRKPMPVLVKINGQPVGGWHHINMMPVGNGDFYLYLNNIIRKSSTAQVGDNVGVELDYDQEYRSGPAEMQAWFAEALDVNPIAKANWENLSPSRQKEVIRYFDNLKSEEAKARNKKRALEVLSGKDARFMGRDWHGGA